MASEGAASFRGREEKPSITRLHFIARFSASQAQIQAVNKQTQPLPLPPSVLLKSAEAPQLRRPQVNKRGLKSPQQTLLLRLTQLELTGETRNLQG